MLKVYAARYKDRLFGIDHVPMQVCDFCGDTLPSLETVEGLEQLRDNPQEPAGTIPLYEFASAKASGREAAPNTSVVAD